MPNTAPARRVATVDEIERPGDYCGPQDEVNAEHEKIGTGVWFLLPIADPADPMRRDFSSRETWDATQGNGMHRVTEPPWTFRECADGSLEIRASIACSTSRPDGPNGEMVAIQYWHGYLNEGNVWSWD
jgi:hypothetical protein